MDFSFFGQTKANRAAGKCANPVDDCKNPDVILKKEDFRDTISFREYGISGLCQSCQDDVFGGEE